MPILDNPRHEAFALEVANGRPLNEAAKLAGYRGKNIHITGYKLTHLGLVAARINEIREEIKDAVLVDAKKLHRRWSEMFEADIGDIMTETGAFKPIKEWPRIWRQMLSGMDVKELFEHSKDGGGASWDKIGEVVKLKFVSVKDIGELIGRHKAVDAFVKQGNDAKEVATEVLNQVQQILQEGHERARRLQLEAKEGDVIDTHATLEKDPI